MSLIYQLGIPNLTVLSLTRPGSQTMSRPSPRNKMHRCDFERRSSSRFVVQHLALSSVFLFSLHVRVLMTRRRSIWAFVSLVFYFVGLSYLVAFPTVYLHFYDIPSVLIWACWVQFNTLIPSCSLPALLLFVYTLD